MPVATAREPDPSAYVKRKWKEERGRSERVGGEREKEEGGREEEGMYVQENKKKVYVQSFFSSLLLLFISASILKHTLASEDPAATAVDPEPMAVESAWLAATAVPPFVA